MRGSLARLASAVIAGAFVSLLVPRPAAGAPPDKQACVDAATRGQIQRDDLKLSAAAEAFITCAAASCPAAVRKSCAEWLEDVEGKIPSVTAHLHDGGEATLRIDGADASFDAPLNLDPGSHTARVEPRGSAPFTESFSLQQGEHKTLDLRPAPAPSPTRPPDVVVSRPVPLSVMLLGGVAVLGGASFAVFGLTAKAKTDRLTGECAPACPTGDRDSAHRVAVLADVSLLVGSAAVVAAAVLFFTRPEHRRALIARGFEF